MTAHMKTSYQNLHGEIWLMFCSFFPICKQMVSLNIKTGKKTTFNLSNLSDLIVHVASYPHKS